MKTWFSKVRVEELEWLAQSPDLISTEHLLKELECQQCHIPLCLTSVPNLTNTLMAEWANPTVTFQHPVESVPRKVEVIIAANGGLHLERATVFIKPIWV